MPNPLNGKVVGRERTEYCATRLKALRDVRLNVQLSRSRSQLC